ncbi:MAG TPA: hypothetical protein VFD92_04975 [Candidatus Binatia bacterium]|nr:hypothetical protein [Candidatus Binatia bacterium]
MKSNGRDTNATPIDGVRAIRGCDSGLALLCAIPGNPPRELWVPHSVIMDDSEVFEPGHEGQLVVKPWFAFKEGLADY